MHPKTLRLGSPGFSKTPKILVTMIRGYVVLWILDARVLQ